MQRGKPPGNFRWIRGVRSWQLDPERLRLQRIRSIIKSIQRDLDEGGRAHVRQIMKGPELYRIELERPDWSYNRTHHPGPRDAHEPARSDPRSPPSEAA